jgi:hypothetical protein
MGQVAFIQRDSERAKAYLARSLALFHTLNSRLGIAECLEYLAGVIAAQGQLVPAVRLLGAAEALRNGASIPLSTVEHVAYDRIVESVRGQMDPVTFAAAWAAGRALSLAQAIAEALEESTNS